MTQLLVVTDLPTPYRQPVFAALADELDLHVLYLSQRSQRPWRWWDDLGGHESDFLDVAVPRGAAAWARASRRLLRSISALRPEVIVAGGWDHPTTWAALASGVPTGLWIESTAEDERTRGPLTEAAKRLLLRRSAGAVVPGTRSAHYARALGATRVVVAPNAVDNRSFAMPAPAGPHDGLPRPRVLFVGRLATEKGLDVLVSAMALLRARRPASLVLLGDGPLRATVERQLGRAGVPHLLAGATPDPRIVASHLHHSDVLVLPSSSEPWGLVVNEAMAAGLPAVVSDAVGCSPDLVEPGRTGEVFRSGSARDLAAALDRALDIPRDRAAVACRDIAARHSPQRCADGFVAFHRQVVAGT